MTDSAAHPSQAAEVIKQHTPDFPTPRLGIVLGSGLGAFVESIDDAIEISYTDLPGFPQPTVKGHTGKLTLGYLSGVPVICLQGRSHFYETESFDEVKVYIRTLKLLGCTELLLTNATGSLRPEVGPGSLVAVTDHINFLGKNPLVGPNDDEFGPRFPPLDNCYDAELRQLMTECASKLNIPLPMGVYICVSGPSYETEAEIRAFSAWGADVVGMSTVPEVIIATHCGLKVVTVSTVTNLATGLSSTSHDHNDVVATANAASENLKTLIQLFVQRLAG